MRVIVIGGGPAGIRATRTIKALKPDTEVVLFRPEYKSLIYCAMPYVIEDIFPVEKIYKKDELITDIGAQLIRQSIVEVDLSSKRVKSEDGSWHKYDKLLIATGADPIIPPFVPKGLTNVFVFKREEHLRGVLDRVKSGAQKAVVVGAGSIGIEVSQAFNKAGLETHLIEMADHILPNLIDKEMAEILEEKIRKTGIHLHLSNPVQEVRGADYAERILLKDGTEIELNKNDIVLFSIGLKPNVELFDKSGLEIRKDGIVVDNHMRTNIEDVYAAGDCCSFYSGIDHKPILGKLATNAVPMGKIAGINIAGEDAEYDGFYNGAATIVQGIRIGGTGFNEPVAKGRGFSRYVVGYGETTTMFPIFPDPGFVKVKLIVNQEDHRLIGAQVVGTMCITERIDLLTFAIQNKTSVEKLAKLSYSAQPYQSFFPANNAIVIAAEDALKQIG